MKGVLEFYLPEEQKELERAVKAYSYTAVITEMDNYLRGKLKYEQLTEEQYKLYQSVRDKLHEIIAEQEVEI